MTISETDTGFWWFIGAVIVFFVIVLLVGIVSFSYKFINELKYINDEIHRTEGMEQRYWKRRRRRLWLSLFPFFKY